MFKSYSAHAVRWIAVGWLFTGCTGSAGSAGDPSGPSGSDPEGVVEGDGPLARDVAIVPVRGGWLVPTQIAKDGQPTKLYVVLAKEDVQIGKASLQGATLPDLGIGKNPFGHPEGYYRIQYHSKLPLAADQRVRIFVADSRDMKDATMFTVTPDLNATQSGGFFAEQGMEYHTNGSHQLGVGLGTNASKMAEFVATIQSKYDTVASVEGLPQTKLHYELNIAPLARMGFNANEPLAGTINRNQPILVADRLRTILAAEMVEHEDPDYTTAKPCNGPVDGEPTPDPTDCGESCGDGSGDDVSDPTVY
jgi:hypothetical protein